MSYLVTKVVKGESKKTGKAYKIVHLVDVDTLDVATKFVDPDISIEPSANDDELRELLGSRAEELRFDINGQLIV